MSHPALYDALNDPKNGECAVKHLKQQVCFNHNNLAFGYMFNANVLCDEMAHQIQALAARPGDLSSVL